MLEVHCIFSLNLRPPSSPFIGTRYGTLSEFDKDLKQGTQQHGTKVRAHALTPSHGLVDMAPILHQLARESVPCVIHSAVANIGDDLSITPDLSGILIFLHCILWMTFITSIHTVYSIHRSLHGEFHHPTRSARLGRDLAHFVTDSLSAVCAFL